MSATMRDKSVFLFLTALLLLFGSKRLAGQQLPDINVYFETNSAIATRKEINKLSGFISKIDSTATLTLYGYCDDVGDVAANKKLSVKRVEHVFNLLLRLKVDSSRIEKLQGMGEVALLEHTDSSVNQQRDRNRKVKILVSYKKPTVISSTPKANSSQGVIRSEFTDKLKVGEKLLVKGILFSPGRHIFLKESYASLKELVVQLNRWKKYVIRLEGHICNAGIPPGEDGEDFDTHIKNLSEARAKAVYDYLVASDIDPTRLSYTGLKGDFPTKQGCDADRRVEVEIIGINK